MTDQTKQITTYDRTKQLFKHNEIQEQFQAILGRRAAGFIASVISTVYINPDLRDCEPNTVLMGAVKAAVLDLPVEPNLGFSALVPYRNKGRKEAQFQVMWRGLVQLAQRTGEYRYLNATEIWEGQEVGHDQLTGALTINGKRVSDEVIAYIGYFQLHNGFEHFEKMTVDEIHAHAKRYSKSYGNENSPWTKNFPEMAKKTVLKKVLKFGPLSIDLKRALADEDEAQRVDHGDVIDAEARDLWQEAEVTMQEVAEVQTEVVQESEAQSDEPENSENGNGDNPDPITDSAWSEWLVLVERAEKAGVKVPKVDREKKTKAELKEIYDDLRKKVLK